LEKKYDHITGTAQTKLAEVEAEVEKDGLTQDVCNKLRLAQFVSSGSANVGMNDFKINSIFNVDSDGENNAKSNLINISYNILVNENYGLDLFSSCILDLNFDENPVADIVTAPEDIGM
jgi:hypothetical protein